MGSAPTDRDAGVGPVTRVRDELVWELVRDEWDLLLAIGSGPTTVEVAAEALGRALGDARQAVERLEAHGVVRASAGGYSLVPAFYERREGMASYLRDVVLDGLRDDGAAPVAGLVRTGLGCARAVAAFIREAEQTLLPEVVTLASAPESAASERFSLLFAAVEGEGVVRGGALRSQVRDVLRAAAAARSLEPDGDSAYLWAAEMRADPHVAMEIGERMQQFLEVRGGAEGTAGAAAFAVLPARR